MIGTYIIYMYVFIYIYLTMTMCNNYRVPRLKQTGGSKVPFSHKLRIVVIAEVP